MTTPTAISLFSGAGGMDYGFEAAGFRTAVALEFEHDCCDTLRVNRNWPVIERDIFKVTTKELLKTGGLKKGEVDVLIGGPPCQPFSKSSYWVRGDSLRLKDPRADTLFAYMRIVEEAQPKTFLLENVGGLAFGSKDEGLRFLLSKIDAINQKVKTKYRPKFKVMNAADYGVPQTRERFILIASRDGREFEFPKATHRAPNTLTNELPFDNLEPYRTAWDALADVGPAKDEKLDMQGYWGELLPSIPEGNNYLWHTNRSGGLPLFGWRRRYWQFLLKLAKNRPSWTIQAQPGPAIGPFHWENRRLSVSELCRLQTFPDRLKIMGGRTSIQRQLGNAVPSLLAEVLGREIRTQLLGHPRTATKLKLIPSRRICPKPESVRSVPKKYRDMIGDHSAHPGTGKGSGALSRLAAAA